MQRKSAAFLCKWLEIAAIPQLWPPTRTRENVPLHAQGKSSRLFLWRANKQSGFKDSTGRMQCDQKPMVRRKAVGLKALGGNEARQRGICRSVAEIESRLAIIYFTK
jgi:hypothetical protein